MDTAKKHEIKVFATTNLKKDGTEIKNKFGKTSWRTTIQVPEHGQKWITGFLPFQPNWQVGQQVEIIIYEGEEYNGVKQLNFKLPNKEDKIGKQLEQILNNQATMKLMLTKIGQHLMPSKEDAYTKHNVNPNPPEPDFSVATDPVLRGVIAEAEMEDDDLDQLTEEMR